MSNWYCVRSDERVVDITGSDTLSFLQTKLTADTRRWRMTGGGYGVATDINGKVLFDGTFGLSGRHAVAVLPAAHTEFALSHIDQYVIMEDVEAKQSDELVVEFPLATAATLGLSIDAEEPGHVLSFEVTGHEARAFQATGAVSAGDRLLVLIAEDAVQALVGATGAAEKSLDSRLSEEVAAGVPRIDRDFFHAKTIPLEAGLWAGVSLSKGCYLGQEVLERLFSRGSAARRLVAFGLEEGTVEAGADVLAGESVAGQVTSCVPKGTGAVGLVYIKRKFADADLSLEDGRAITRAGFVGGDWPKDP